MRKIALFLQSHAELLISPAALVLNLLFTFAYLFVKPYSGFYFNPSTAKVLQIYVNAEPGAALEVGDAIQKIGGVDWATYKADGTLVFFKDSKPGDVAEIEVLRNGRETNVPWIFPGFTEMEFKGRFFNLWWLGYIFWFFGMLVNLSVRPKDARSRLLAIASYLIGVWVILGGISESKVWGGSLLLHALTWVLLPVYLHLHWVFPRPLKGMPVWGWAVLYLAGFTLAIAELRQAVPRTLFGLGFLFTLVGSIVLLIVHAIRQPDQRREVALLGVAIAIAVFPSISLSIARLTNEITQTEPLALVALPIIPGVYFFTVYRRQLGGLELRANRALSIYFYLSLLGGIVLLLIAPAATIPISHGALVISEAMVILVAALVSILGFPAFQRFVEQRLLGIKLPPQNLLEVYSSRIATSTSITGLLQTLTEEVFPSLLVRQFAFLQLSDNDCRAVLVQGVEADQLPDRDGANGLLSLAGRFRPPEEGQPHPWLRLVLSLKAGEAEVGLWLLGRRDPDDLYHAVEIPIFQSLADQTAIAMSNLLQSERLRSLYHLDIDRREQERMRLALDLHDSVLNQLAALRMNVDESTLAPGFQEAYEEVVQRLREIVSDLRPPMLNYGLKLALEELAQDLMERSENHARVSLALWGEEERYPAQIELHLFRIVQEACENALRHAKASNVVVSAQLDLQGVNLEIQDDGVGFPMGERQDLNDLLTHKHFGLAGIIERANLIGARASIHSGAETGTRICVVWNVPPPS